MPEVVSGFDLISRLPNLGLVSIAGNVEKDLCEVKVADLILDKNKIGKTIIDLLNSFKQYYPLFKYFILCFENTYIRAGARIIP